VLIASRSEVPFKPSARSQEMFVRMYPKLGEVGHFTIYHDTIKTDMLSFSYHGAVCPGMRIIERKYHSTEIYRENYKNSLSLITPIMQKVYGAAIGSDISTRLQTLRYAQYYHFLPKPFLSRADVATLKEGRRLLRMRKGFFLPKVYKTGCHNIFRQLLNLFDFAIARDKIDPQQFQDVAAFYHKVLAGRDSAYVARYRWLMANPELLTQLRAVVFENHDDLIYMMLRALTTLDNKDIVTPFASTIAIELHKDRSAKKNDQKYFVRLKYNDLKLSLPFCDPQKCPLKLFVKTLKQRGMYLNDQRFYSVCHNPTPTLAPAPTPSK
jgi:hypothetical protein